MTVADTMVRGGSWLTEDTPSDMVLTPERLDDEHRLIAQAAAEFMEGEVQPALEALEQKDWQLARRLVPCASLTAATPSTAKRCGSRTEASPTSTSSSPRWTASSSRRSSSSGASAG